MNIWILSVSAEAKEAVPDAPDEVHLQLKEATNREVAWLEQAKKELLSQNGAPLFTELVMRRAEPPIDRRLARELALDLTPSQSAELMHAFISGERDTTGKFSELARETLTGLLPRILMNWPDSERLHSSVPPTD